MKKVLFATAALVATAGVASAHGIGMQLDNGHFGSPATLVTASLTFDGSPAILGVDGPIITDQAAATGFGETGAYDLMRDTAGLTFEPEIKTGEIGADGNLLTADLGGLPVPDLTDGATSQTLAFEAWGIDGGMDASISFDVIVSAAMDHLPAASATGLPVFSST